MPRDDTAVDDTAVYVMKVDMLDGVTILRSEKVKDEIVLDGNDIELAFCRPYQPAESNRIQTLSLLMRMVMLPEYFLFDVMQMSLLYFKAQLSGRLPHGQRVASRDHFGLTDGLEEGMDLVGGYYNAGDHVKFGLPMAFTVTMLLWSLLEYGSDVTATGELAHTLESIKWGTDYFVKAHTKPDELWAESCTADKSPKGHNVNKQKIVY
ncbi:endoglucanase 16-like [Hordeum vulgare]|nr:endoglucanase 16-like [Hordeum vulgare]